MLHNKYIITNGDKDLNEAVINRLWNLNCRWLLNEYNYSSIMGVVINSDKNMVSFSSKSDLNYYINMGCTKLEIEDLFSIPIHSNNDNSKKIPIHNSWVMGIEDEGVCKRDWYDEGFQEAAKEMVNNIFRRLTEIYLEYDETTREVKDKWSPACVKVIEEMKNGEIERK